VPLARALAELAGEYHAIGNLPVARRHMNASLRSMRRALYDESIDDGRRRAVVDFLWQSASLHYDKRQLQQAIDDIDEALRWDRATWDAHAFCLGPRELRHAHILKWKAKVLAELGRHDEAADARAEAIFMALGDLDGKGSTLSDSASSIANDLVSEYL